MNQYKFLTKKTIVVSVLVFVVGVSIGGYLILRTETGRAGFLEQLTKGIEGQDSKDDLDHDGLKNWEEKIHKTDPNNPDTDGDGYLDGEEVATGFDPTKPAPDDRLKNNTSQRKRPSSGNLTETLSYFLGQQMKEDIFPLANIQNTDLLNQMLEQSADENITEALGKTLVPFISGFIPPHKLQNKEPLTTNDGSLTAIGQYAKQASDKIGQVYGCQDPNNLKDEVDIIQEAIETENFSQTNCLAESYKKAYHELMSTPVPSVWLSIHQEFLTILWNFHVVHRSLPQNQEDPLKGLMLVKKFKLSFEELDRLSQKIQIDLEQRRQ